MVLPNLPVILCSWHVKRSWLSPLMKQGKQPRLVKKVMRQQWAFKPKCCVLCTSYLTSLGYCLVTAWTISTDNASYSGLLQSQIKILQSVHVAGNLLTAFSSKVLHNPILTCPNMQVKVWDGLQAVFNATSEVMYIKMCPTESKEHFLEIAEALLEENYSTISDQSA